MAKISRITSVRSTTLTSSCSFEIARLCRAQVVIENDDVGFVGLDEQFKLVDLARADVGRDINLMPLLQHLAHHVQVGSLRQTTKLVQRIVGRKVGAGQDDADQNGTFFSTEPLDTFCFDQGGI